MTNPLGTKLANFLHKGTVLGSCALFSYFTWCLGYNFYLNWNMSVKMSDENMQNIGIGKKTKSTQRAVTDAVAEHKENTAAATDE